MISNAKLFSVGDFDFRLQHLLIIGILVIAMTSSGLIRGQPAQYGFELMEFDPFFNYRATQYIVDNGYEEYLEWDDDMSWYPYGRDVSRTSQVVLHLTTATLYNIFGGNSSLYDFTVIFPLVLGSLTCVVVFALVRVIGGTTAGLIASLMFAVALPITFRTLIGWYKSEPLGLFLGLIGLYLFLSSIRTNKGAISITKTIFGGIFIALSLSAWGGNQFFLLPLAIFLLALPFFKKDNKFLLWIIPTFSISIILTTLSFERPGLGFLTGVGGIIILTPTIFMMAIIVVQHFSSATQKLRNSIFVLITFVGTGIGISVVPEILGIRLGLPSFRYMNAMNPFLSTNDPLVTSVSEHQMGTLESSFFTLSVFILFGIIGAWIIFTQKSKTKNISLPPDMKAFVLIFGLVGIYTASSFARLEIFASLALIFFGSIGLSILLKQISEKQSLPIKSIFCIVIIGLFITPLIYPENQNWISGGDVVPTIFSGASIYPHDDYDDWIDAMQWMKGNTPKDAVIFSWWDYGYWIETLGERKTIIDNATIDTSQIGKVARTFLSPTNNAWAILHTDYRESAINHFITVPTIEDEYGNPGLDRKIGDYYRPCVELFTDLEVPERTHEFGLYYWEDYSYCDEYFEKDIQDFGPLLPSITGIDADYVLIYVSGLRYETETYPVYDLNGGGDESKKQWFMMIAGVQPSIMLEKDGFTPKPFFMENTLFGQLLPYSIITYFDKETREQHDSYKPGLVPIYVQNIKLDDPDGPFSLVYASPSFSETDAEAFSSVLIYKINHDFLT